MTSFEKHPNGTKEWRLNDKRHRLDGPAVEWANGDKEWYLNGNKVSAEEIFNLLPKEGRLKASFNLDQWI